MGYGWSTVIDRELKRILYEYAFVEIVIVGLFARTHPKSSTKHFNICHRPLAGIAGPVKFPVSIFVSPICQIGWIQAI
jgi:hypothetical protein